MLGEELVKTQVALQEVASVVLHLRQSVNGAAAIRGKGIEQ